MCCHMPVWKCCLAGSGPVPTSAYAHAHTHTHKCVSSLKSNKLYFWFWFCLCLKTASPVYWGHSIPWWQEVHLKCSVRSNWMAVSLEELHPLMCFRFTAISETGSWPPPGSRNRRGARQSVCCWHVAWPPEPEEANFAVEAHIHWLWGKNESVFLTAIPKQHGEANWVQADKKYIFWDGSLMLYPWQCHVARGVA